MNTNAKPSEIVALLQSHSPQSQAASTVNTNCVDVSKFHTIMAVIQTGVLGASATVDFSLQQATDTSATGVKNIAGKSLTQIVKASGDDKQAIINLRVSDLDVEGGYDCVRMKIIVGTAASLVSAQLYGIGPRMAPASDSNPASVVQVV